MADDKIDPAGVVASLEAAIARKEQVARAVKPLGYTTDLGGNRMDEWFSHVRVRYASEDGMPQRLPDGDAHRHFSDNDPASVLAMCEAHRRVLELHKPMIIRSGVVDPAGGCVAGCSDPYGEPGSIWPCDTFRAISAGYGLTVGAAGDTEGGDHG